MLSSVFSALFLFTPEFGQVNLWLDGSINYLWGSTICILYVLIIISLYSHEGRNKPISLAGSFLLSFIVGAWAENSGGAMLVFLLGLCVSRCIEKKKISLPLIICIFSELLGFVFLISAPAEMKNKVGDLSIAQIIQGVNSVFSVFESFIPLCIATAVLLVLCFLSDDIDKKHLTYAILEVIAGLAGAFCLAIGEYVAERSFFFTVPMLILADASMISMLAEKEKKLIFSTMIVLVLFMTKEAWIGLQAVSGSYIHLKSNETYIMECVQNGVYDIGIHNVETYSKYSALHGLKYLDMEDPKFWPNNSMAKYYGANTIFCIKESEG